MDFGKYISEKIKLEKWGSKTIEKLANFMKEKEFYIKMCIKENYCKRELDRQISSGYFQRYLLSDGKAQPLRNLSIEQDKYLNTKILDTYTLEFLNLPQEYSERDFRKAIISNLKSFILEIGKDFTFIGEEYRI